MKNIKFLCFLFVITMISCSEKKVKNEEVATAPVQAEAKAEDDGVVIVKQTMEDTLKGSLKSYVKGTIGAAELKITYHSPSVRGRIVWGGLVPFDKVWVTGAHMATTLESNTDFNLNNKMITAGKYALFTIPGKDKWTVIINKNWQQHLTDEYDSADDIVRMEITPIQLADNQERLRYEITSGSDKSGSINMSWDKLQIQIPLSIQ